MGAYRRGCRMRTVKCLICWLLECVAMTSMSIMECLELLLRVRSSTGPWLLS